MKLLNINSIKYLQVEIKVTPLSESASGEAIIDDSGQMTGLVDGTRNRNRRTLQPIAGKCLINVYTIG